MKTLQQHFTKLSLLSTKFALVQGKCAHRMTLYAACKLSDILYVLAETVVNGKNKEQRCVRKEEGEQLLRCMKITLLAVMSLWLKNCSRSQIIARNFETNNNLYFFSVVHNFNINV